MGPQKNLLSRACPPDPTNFTGQCLHFGWSKNKSQNKYDPTDNASETHTEDQDEGRKIDFIRILACSYNGQ